MAKENAVVKKNSMSGAESKEVGQGRGKLLSFDGLKKWSRGLPVSIAVLKVNRHLCITEVTYCIVCQGRRTNAKDKRKKAS